MIKIFHDSSELGRAAADMAAAKLRDTIARQGRTRIIAATGSSQFSFLKELTASRIIDWRHVEMFHLDEYVGLPMTHRASFRKYLLERLIKPAGIGRYHLLDGESDVAAVCRRVGAELNAAPIDMAFVGIGENGHLAFNDPPADFATAEPYIIVNLDEACRRQQVAEGWFKDLSEVPHQAISMSIRQILKAQKILCIVPDKRKALAVKACLEGGISPATPASILRTHIDVTFYLDKESSSLLNQQILAEHSNHEAK
ncbi:MAG TPA: glucosamine-6-phosphate deaminase [Verrucomicrobiae bacterium]|nr:glucosamine-6-phosphate deaminase [Verrucomicrobiae bacterium]